MSNKILVADDNQGLLRGIERALKQMKFDVTAVTNGKQALAVAEHQSFDLALLDFKMPYCDGLTVIRQLKKINPFTRTLLMTSYGTLETAIEALRLEVSDYLLKPFSISELELRVQQVLARHHLFTKETSLPIEKERGQHNFLGESPPIAKIKQLVQTVAPTSSSVLMLGETGTGKECLAQDIHHLSPRASFPFVAINCAVLSEGLLESELFGHEKGAFTGALNQKKGLLEAANGGTILFDEVGDIPLDFQTKLLRFIQEHEFQRVGGTQTIKVDVRIIAATNRNLKEDVKNKLFREDLLYRLNVFEINLPPLRERMDDLSLLANHFLQKYQTRMQKRTSLLPLVMEVLKAYSWPGNIRELENVIERAVVLVSNNQPIGLEEFPDRITISFNSSLNTREHGEKKKESLVEIEKEVILKILQKNHWNQTKTAHQLGVKRTTLQYHLNKYGLLNST